MKKLFRLTLFGFLSWIVTFAGSVSRQTINAIETEKYDPSLPLAFKVTRLFKLPIEDIFEP